MSMHYSPKILGIAIVVSAAFYIPNAVAQEITSTSICQNIGSGGDPEPIGDREGHSVSVDMVSCRVEGGPLSGGVLTGTDIWEWDGPNAVSLANDGVVRKPGATAVYKNTEAKIALTITDGKVTGWTASGKGHWAMATGSASSLAGKSCTYTAKPTSPGQFTAESKCQ